jgi:hypothetical protein
MDEEKRGTMEYLAMATFEAKPNIPRREITMIFRGMPEEEHNLAITLPVGIAPALSVMIYGACAKIDDSTADHAAHMQPMQLTDAQAADPAMGQCTLLLDLNGMRVPTLLSKKTALRVIAELKLAVKNLEKPVKSNRLS